MSAIAVSYSGGATRRVAIYLDASADPTPVAVTLTAMYARTANETGLSPPRSTLLNQGETVTLHGQEAAALIAAGGAVLA